MEDGPDAVQAAGSGAPQSTTVPWNQIPKFVPGQTDVRVYARKLEFLKELWPSDYIQYLGPRAALLVEGVAFQKVSRLDPAKLKQANGVKYLVEALGGSWGKLDSEEKYDLFEKALFQVSQRGDESNDSYLARHDAAFEDLEAKSVTIAEIRAYILLRQSTLSPEDRKRVVVDAAGALTYTQARKSLRLLGSKFFQELQTGGKSAKTKTYDVNTVEEEHIHTAMEDEEWDEEAMIAHLYESGDEDAAFINEFEDQIVAACQEIPELSSCFSTYVEARNRLRERARGRGFWPLSNGAGKGKGKGKSAGKPTKGWSKGTYRKSLADRIANSTCRRCGQPGHWKRECPLATMNTNAKSSDGDAFTGITVETDLLNDMNEPAEEIMLDLPADARPFEEAFSPKPVSVDHVGVGHLSCASCLFAGEESQGKWSRFGKNLTERLSQLCRKATPRVFKPPPNAASSPTAISNSPRDTSVAKLKAEPEDLCFAEEAADEAIVDTGASRTVVGSDRLKILMASLPPSVRKSVKRVPTKGVVFKFGNSGRLTSEYAVLFPRSKGGWLRAEVVPGQTPFLISNAMLKGLGCLVDVVDDCLRFKDSDVTVPLVMVRKNLLGVKLRDLLSPAIPVSTAHTQAHILCTTDGPRTETADVSNPPAHHMHENPQHGRIHTHFVNDKKTEAKSGDAEVEHSMMSHTAAEVHSFEVTTRSNPRTHRGVEHGEPISSLPCPDAEHPGGPKPGTGSDSRGAPDASATSSRNQQPHRLGGDGDDRRQAHREDICLDLRAGSRLCQPSSEPQAGCPADEELPDVQSSTSGGESREEPQGVSGPQSDADDSSRQATVQAKGQSGSQWQQEEHAIPGGRGIPMDGGSGRRGQDRSSASPDSHSAAPTRRRGEADGSRADGGDECSSRALGKGKRKSAKSVSYHEVSEHIDRIVENITSQLDDMKVDYAYINDGSSLKHQRTHGIHDKKGIDLLEVYCEPNSQLTHQIHRLGGKTLRFTRQHGDLGTEEGRKSLWTWIHLFEPRHIWVAPECRLWGSFARFNMGRSMESCTRIEAERQSALPHLQLCNQIYLHQISRGYHFHLEQPQGSEMIHQADLMDVRLGTLPATFDMCQVGKLRLPSSDSYLRKRTQVFSTSRNVFDYLDGALCQGNHQHAAIKGNFKYRGKWTRISQYAQTYTAHFARRVAEVIVWECQCPEHPMLLDELVLGLEDHEPPELAHEMLRESKRRRLEMKQPESALYGQTPQWRDIFRSIEKSTARVGNTVFGRQEVVSRLVQKLVPEMTVRAVVACRGTERHRIPGPNLDHSECVWRKTIILHRHTGEVHVCGAMEEWKKLTRAKQVRSTGPAKISLTVFGVKSSCGGGCEESHESAASISNGQSDVAAPSLPHPSSEESAVPLEVGWAPKCIPRSGPSFEALDAAEKSDLRRLHNNLGHPDPARMVRFLTERGAKPHVIAACKDMSCDTCVETQKRPRLHQPGRIHPNLDFNDLVGVDGAYWTNSKGKKFYFVHMIDEATLYHVGAISGRSVEEQIRTFQDYWIQWAGPCKLLYLDPAGEYVNETWANHLQAEGIKVAMTAARAHWQNGRCEIHGKIIKDMLTRMEKDRVIESEADFKLCLRQAFAAKNSLSRVAGFTPEQCLLGKSRALPGSLISDMDATSHCLAESDSSEGQRFRESLLRREQARKAYVQADNDSSFRRALLRQSRPGSVEYERGDWLLYWKASKGNNRSERGRWHGPAQLIVSESPRVLWLSHLGHLIRASPEQVRPASLREYSSLPKDSQGRVIDEVPRGRDFVALEGPPAEEDNVSEPSLVPGSSDSVSYVPSLAQSQPEQENSPSEELDDDQGAEEPAVEVGVDDMEVDGAEVPVPNDDDDELLFGDDISGDRSNTVPLVCEINFAVPDEVDISSNACGETQIAETILMATQDRKRRVEVNYRSLSPEDKRLFDAAKAKEVNAWVSHNTVKRVAKGTLKPEQILRCRWIFTWKDPLPGTTERRAKARLVILGFEDPGIGVVPNDAPTLSKDGRQLLLQKVASARWSLVNFDIATAFLKGKGDGRPLGLHAPPELEQAIQLQPGEQCGLEGGAYGRIDAPFLWYKELRATLERLGFIACPFDGCLFSLVTPDKTGRPIVRGLLGIHVDDGIGGGDSFFSQVIQRLRGIYEFGAYNEGEFDFCGVHYKQWDDGSIEMDQGGYLNRIEPIEIPRSRRLEPESTVSEAERLQLRRVCGSVQFAAVHTRPDLAAKVSQLQSKVTRACVKDLLEAKRVLYEGKKNPVCLMVVPIEESQVTFCSFSDASFSTAKELSSRQGTLIFATDAQLLANKRTVMCPMAWSSRRIPRVVTSTLSAEAISLSSSLDRLSYIRICWEWLKDPSIDWSEPDLILRQAPTASAVTDCKSVYDIATKTSTPVCSEYRTTLECLLIRERLQANVIMRWISTQAMLADSLTKSMDSSLLRECLRTGRYALFDEKEALKQRASKRERLQWLKDDPPLMEDVSSNV